MERLEPERRADGRSRAKAAGAAGENVSASNADPDAVSDAATGSAARGRAGDEPTNDDRRIVARQLGRRPRPFSRVTRRCRHGYPQVILTEPLHRRGDRWEVFPTVFWLTCPLLHRAISTLEAEGQIRRFEERIASDEDFASRMERAHASAAAHRVSLVPEAVRKELEQARPREARALSETGIAGIRGAGGVKCLHAHFADFIGRGDNPVGEDVLRLLRVQRVPLDGTEQCRRFCRAEEETDGPSAKGRGRSGSGGAERMRRSAPSVVRRAVIDVGTNSVRLLVADLVSGGSASNATASAAAAPGARNRGRASVRLVPVARNLRTTRLGRGVDRSGHLSAEARNATAEAVRALADEARRHGAKDIVVVGTSALRDAADRETFVEQVRRNTGLNVRVLSGEEEAALSFLGAVRGACAGVPGWGAADGEAGDAVAGGGGLEVRPVFVLDVGGGSTELILGSEDGTAETAVSVDAGAVRMTELCVSSDPISPEDWSRLEAEVEAKLAPVRPVFRSRAATVGRGLKLIAVGGTATTLAAMHQRLEVYDPDHVHGYTLTRTDVNRFVETLKTMTVAERRAWPGLHPQRADIILAGAVIVQRVMAGVGVEKLTVSESDLLQGVLLQGGT